MIEAPTPIGLAQLQPIGEVVDALRELLELAEEGEIRGFCFVGLAGGGCVAQAYVMGDGGLIEMIGACRVLERDLLDEAE